MKASACAGTSVATRVVTGAIAGGKRQVAAIEGYDGTEETHVAHARHLSDELIRS